MTTLKYLSAVYTLAVAIFVGAFFVINGSLPDSVDTTLIWDITDYFMAVGIFFAFVFNFFLQRNESLKGEGAPVTRSYVEANLLFFSTSALALLFFHNWLDQIAMGSDSIGSIDGGNTYRWVVWAVVDTMLPIVLGVTGLRMWRMSNPRG